LSQAFASRAPTTRAVTGRNRPAEFVDDADGFRGDTGCAPATLAISAPMPSPTAHRIVLFHLPAFQPA
jgi:hypothetical protein